MNRYKINPEIRSNACLDTPFSNDEWTQKAVTGLEQRLAAQDIDEEHAAAVGIGSAGMRYIIGKAVISNLFIVDRSQRVLNIFVDSVQAYNHEDVTDWDTWHRHVRAPLGRRQTELFDKEYRIARESGLAGNFEETQRRAAKVKVTTICQDAVEALPELETPLRQQNLEVGIINVTSLAQYLQIGEVDPLRQGMIANAQLIANLPYAAGALLIESAREPSLQPRVHDAVSFIDAYATYVPGSDK
jgi:hypothetical protein